MAANGSYHNANGNDPTAESSSSGSVNNMKELVIQLDGSDIQTRFLVSEETYNAIIYDQNHSLLQKLANQVNSASNQDIPQRFQKIPKDATASTSSAREQPPENDEDTQYPSVHWSKRKTLSLIDKYENLLEKANKGKITKNKLWAEISKEIGGFTSEQCSGRWKTITDAYKRTKDKKNNRKRCYSQV